jgi:hypothetical protein
VCVFLAPKNINSKSGTADSGLLQPPYEHFLMSSATLTAQLVLMDGSVSVNKFRKTLQLSNIFCRAFSPIVDELAETPLPLPVESCLRKPPSPSVSRIAIATSQIR